MIPEENNTQDSLFEKIVPILDDYLLAKLKIEQLRARGETDLSLEDNKGFVGTVTHWISLPDPPLNSNPNSPNPTPIP